MKRLLFLLLLVEQTANAEIIIETAPFQAIWGSQSWLIQTSLSQSLSLGFDYSQATQSDENKSYQQLGLYLDYLIPMSSLADVRFYYGMGVHRKESNATYSQQAAWQSKTRRPAAEDTWEVNRETLALSQNITVRFQYTDFTTLSLRIRHRELISDEKEIYLTEQVSARPQFSHSLTKERLTELSVGAGFRL